MRINSRQDRFLQIINAFTVVLLAVLFVLFGGFMHYAWIREKEHTVRELTGLLKFSEEFTAEYLKRVGEGQRRIALDLLKYDKEKKEERALSMLNFYKSKNSDHKRLVLLTANGDVFVDTEASAGARSVLNFSDTVARQLRDRTNYDGEIGLERIDTDFTDDAITLGLRYPIRDADGELKYTLHSRLQLSLLQNFWKSSSISPESILGLIHDDGYLIDCYSICSADGLESKSTHPSGELLANHLQISAFPAGGVAEIKSNQSGDRHLVAYRRLGNHPASVFISVPISAMRVFWWDQVEIPFVMLIALLLATAFSYWLLITKRQAERLFMRGRAQLQDVTQGILAAQEQERARISHELHDEIGQSLTALKITIDRAQQNLEKPENAKDLLTMGKGMVDGMIVEIRGIAYRLRPGEIDQLGLAAALRRYLEKTISTLQQDIALSENIGNKRFNRDIELCAFRVVQEAVTNALRHAQATRSNNPPAKPGAFNCEPLKAAVRGR